MDNATDPPSETAPTGVKRVISAALGHPLALSAIVALVLGLTASRTTSEAYEDAFPHPFFSDALHMKAWLTTAALLLASSQVLTALRIYGVLLFGPEGRIFHFAHRWLGRLAVLLTLPVAIHCIFMLGFGTYSSRALVHSLLGSFLYGVLASKVLIVRSDRFQAWALPIAGGALLSIFLALWLTSAFWFFRTFGIGA